MRLSQWRPTIKAFFNTLLAPSGWYVDTPPSNILRYATLPPIMNLGMRYKPPFDLVATITQEVFYHERVSSELWHSIPLEYYEGLYGEVCFRLLANMKDVSPDINSVTIDEFGRMSEMPVTTEQLADGWLISLRWQFITQVAIQPEIADPAYPVTQLDLGVWTARLTDPTFNDRVLDHQVDVYQDDT